MILGAIRTTIRWSSANPSGVRPSRRLILPPRRHWPDEPPGLYCGMKTAISLPDQLFRSGDALAKRLGVSRSELYARALAEYLAKNRNDRITDRLNAVAAAEETRLEPALAAAQVRALPREAW